MRRGELVHGRRARCLIAREAGCKRLHGALMPGYIERSENDV
jgi:hypothetical protein